MARHSGSKTQAKKIGQKKSTLTGAFSFDAMAGLSADAKASPQTRAPMARLQNRRAVGDQYVQRAGHSGVILGLAADATPADGGLQWHPLSLSLLKSRRDGIFSRTPDSYLNSPGVELL
jgi:hypothetical protein